MYKGIRCSYNFEIDRVFRPTIPLDSLSSKRSSKISSGIFKKIIREICSKVFIKDLEYITLPPEEISFHNISFY